MSARALNCLYYMVYAQINTKKWTNKLRMHVMGRSAVESSVSSAAAG